MSEGAFVDHVVIQVEAGTGGSGEEAFRRETFVPRGGPSGGDGGRGGDVILVADSQLATLLDFRYKQHYRAERGQHGQGKNRTGRAGKDMELRVPPGTEVRDEETGEPLGELMEDGDRLVVAKGGRGGRGNAAFATPTHRSPREWEPGAEGEQRRLVLELKLFADVGLVGEPNAGKSTLLGAASAARPKVAEYPFTTLTPNLGVVELPGSRTFVLADIPGIIEGAHEGKGLGHRFLRHIERTGALAFLIPADAPDPAETYRLLRREVHAYSETLAEKPHCVIVSKIDLRAPEDRAPELTAPDAWAVYPVSAVTGEGLRELLEGLWDHARQELAAADEEDEYRP